MVRAHSSPPPTPRRALRRVNVPPWERRRRISFGVSGRSPLPWSAPRRACRPAQKMSRCYTENELISAPTAGSLGSAAGGAGGAYAPGKRLEGAKSAAGLGQTQAYGNSWKSPLPGLISSGSPMKPRWADMALLTKVSQCIWLRALNRELSFFAFGLMVLRCPA